MRASSKEELVEYLEEIKDKLEDIARDSRTSVDIQSELNEVVSDIKDTIYWV